MLSEILRKYLKHFPKDADKFEVLFKQLESAKKLNGRSNYIGHVTGTAIILSPDKEEILVIYHPTMERWQPPGGHWDEDEDGPWLTAEREAIEETGVSTKRRLNLDSDERVPLQIASHLIPTKPPKNEPEHFHHDFRYGFIADSEDLKLEDDVIKDAKWIAYNEIKLSDVMEAFLRAKKLL